jgi:hypothetical protein
MESLEKLPKRIRPSLKDLAAEKMLHPYELYKNGNVWEINCLIIILDGEDHSLLLKTKK